MWEGDLARLWAFACAPTEHMKSFAQPFLEGGEYVPPWIFMGGVLLVSLFMVALEVLFRGISPILFTTYAVAKKKGDHLVMAEWVNNMISSLHAVVATLISLHVIVNEYKMDFSELLWDPYSLYGYSGAVLSGIMWTTGYSVYDTLSVASRVNYNRPSTRDITVLLHHVCIIVVFSACMLAVPRSFCMAGSQIFCLIEFTTPFLNFRHFFKESGMGKELWIVRVNWAIFVAGFFLTRVLFSTYVAFIPWHIVYYHPAEHFWASPTAIILGSLFPLLQYFWFYNLVLMICNKKKLD